MKTIQIEVGKIKPNPFKKFINGGKLYEQAVERLIEGYAQTRFHENLCARENKEGDIELVYGHHRIEAVKRKYGKDYKIELKVYDFSEFSDEKMIIDMIRENLIQRGGEDYRDMADSIMLIKHWLEGTVNQVDSSKKTHKKEVSIRDIADFLSSQGKSISHEQVNKYITIEEKLHPTLKKQVERGNRAGKVKENKIGFEVASELAKFNEDEQHLLWKEIKKMGCNKDKIKKILNEYKSSPKEIKEKVKKGKISLDEIKLEIFKKEVKQKAEKEKENKKKKVKIISFKKFQRDAGNNIGETNEKIFKTCAFFDILQKQGILNQLDWNTMYKIIEAGQEGGKRYTKFMEIIMKKL